MNCSFDHFVHTITSLFLKTYTGQMSVPFKIRTLKHKKIHNHNLQSFLAKHFITDHNPKEFLKYFIIPSPYKHISSSYILLRREAFWIHQVKSLIPLSLIGRLNLPVFPSEISVYILIRFSSFCHDATWT